MATRPLIPIVLLALVTPWAAAEAAPGRLATMSELEVNEPVEGDVVAIGADVVLGPQAVVSGHAISIFGKVRVQPGARVGGRVIALSSLASLTVDRVRGTDGRRADLGVKLLVAGGWLLVTTLITFLWPARVRRGAAALTELGMRTVALGLLVAVTLVAALIAAIGFGPMVGVPLAVAIAVAFTVGKAFGLAVTGAWLGSAGLQRLAPGRVHPSTSAVFLGVAAMLMVRFLPVVGGAAWTAVVVVSLGAAVFAAAITIDRSSAKAAGTPRPTGS